MSISESVVNRHILEEIHDVFLEECFDHCVIKARVHEYGSEVSL